MKPVPYPFDEFEFDTSNAALGIRAATLQAGSAWTNPADGCRLNGRHGTKERIELINQLEK